MSAWIKIIEIEEAEGKLKDYYDAATTPHGTVDNVMKIHSLRPETMQGHVTLYRSILHHKDNNLPIWLLELIGVYTSRLNNCAYSETHHMANYMNLMNDKGRAYVVKAAMENDRPEIVFNYKEMTLFNYARKLTLEPGNMEATDVNQMKEAGYDDGEILELNQVIGYFNYANRLLNGLGVTTEGDIIGYYD